MTSSNNANSNQKKKQKEIDALLAENDEYSSGEDDDHHTLLLDDDSKRHKKRPTSNAETNAMVPTTNTTTTTKRIIGMCMGFLVLFLLYDAIFRPPEQRFIKPDASDRFLRWVQHHPLRGIIAFMLVIAIAVVLLVPVGTPLTIGCGFVYKSAYGWKLGFTIATIVSMSGSAMGACTCFLLGRYLLRDHVRTWIKNYPLFVAIDIAAEKHGLKILAMLYLTPIAPLGPLSYMSGTTSMALSHFALAKLASLPIMMLYVFIGASAGALVAASSRDAAAVGGGAGQEGHLEEEAHKIEDNPVLIIIGIIMSVVMISTISVYIKKELMKILEQQKKLGGAHVDYIGDDDKKDEEQGIVELEKFGGSGSGSSSGPRHRVVSTDRNDLIEKGGKLAI